jgi:replication factor A1
MKVNELKDKGAVDEIILKITSKDEVKEMRGGSLRLCNCKGSDETGEVNVALWNDDVDKVNEGDSIKIKKGWSQVYQGEMQVSSGKFGSIEILK